MTEVTLTGDITPGVTLTGELLPGGGAPPLPVDMSLQDRLNGSDVVGPAGAGYSSVANAAVKDAISGYDGIQAAITAKGQAVPIGTPVADYPDKIAAIGDWWTPPTDWPDIKTILKNDTTTGYGGSYIQLITDHFPTIALSGALAYRTSDGAFYATATVTHTWNTAKDTPSSLGYATRWVIGYTNAVSAVNLNEMCLWTVLNLDLSSTSSIMSKNMMQSFEFMSGKNIAPTITNLTNMFSGCYVLQKIPDPFVISNVTNMSTAFYNCYMVTLPEVFDLSKCTIATSMLYACRSITKLPKIFDLSKCTNASSILYGCSALTQITNPLDLSSNTVSTTMFTAATNIKNIRLIGVKVSTDMSQNRVLTRDDLVFTLSNLQTATGQTLTLGATNLAMLTTNDIAIATAKGWTLV